MDSPRGLQMGAESPLPKPVRDLITKARTSWLKNTEVLDLLQNYSKYRFQLNKETPICPPGGTLYLFNRKVTRFFRRDGHNWRKKADGKTIRETHEKLKVGTKEALNCYYAHADQEDQLQRRCYWMLEGDDSIVLVHYLAANPAARLRPPGAVPLTAANLAMQPRGLEAPSSSDATSVSSLRSESHHSTASSYSDAGDFARAGSAPERLGSFTFGSGSVRRASDGRCHFTITTGNTRPGPDALPLAQEGMGALGLGGSAAAGIGGSHDGGGAAPMTDGRAASLPSSLGEALQRAQLAQLHQQLAAGSRGHAFGLWNGNGGRDPLASSTAAHQHQQHQQAAAAALQKRPLGAWPPTANQAAAADAAARLLVWQQQQAALQQVALAAQQSAQQHRQQHFSDMNGAGCRPSSWQAEIDLLGWRDAAVSQQQQQQQQSAVEQPRPRLPAAGVSAFAAPQVQAARARSAFAAAAAAPTSQTTGSTIQDMDGVSSSQHQTADPRSAARQQ